MYHVAAATHKGTVKSQNEDHVLVNGKIINEGYVEINAEKVIACVADGVSGEAGGNIASKLVLEVFKQMKDQPINEALILKAFQFAHQTLRKEKKYPYMATTLAGVFLDDTQSATFNVGDSKVFVNKFGALRQISIDHTTKSELLKLGIDKDVNPHQISRFLGGKDTFSKPEIKEASGKIKNTNNYLLICSDGLTDFVKIEYIENVLNSDKTLLEKTKTLIALAIKCRTTDNVSVILVEWKED